MNRIKLFNRDGADLYLENIKDDIWELKVDDKHQWVLKYMRCGGKFDIDENNNINWEERTMIGPSGGPYLEVGDIINNYKIIEICSETTLRLEANNN